MIKSSIPNINKIFKYLVAQNFEGGQITSDGGVYLLAQIDNIYGITGRLSKCFTDYINEKLIEFDVEKILRKITYNYCLKYKDHNDHDELNSDPVLAATIGIDCPDGFCGKSEKYK